MSLIESSFHSSPLALLISNSQLKVITANKKAKDTTYATVEAGGLVTGVSLGSTSTIATLEGISSNEVMVVVNKILISVSLDQVPAVELSDRTPSIALTATGTYDDGSTEDVTDSVTWTIGSQAETYHISLTEFDEYGDFLGEYGELDRINLDSNIVSATGNVPDRSNYTVINTAPVVHAEMYGPGFTFEDNVSVLQCISSIEDPELGTCLKEFDHKVSVGGLTLWSPSGAALKGYGLTMFGADSSTQWSTSLRTATWISSIGEAVIACDKLSELIGVNVTVLNQDMLDVLVGKTTAELDALGTATVFQLAEETGSALGVNDYPDIDIGVRWEPGQPGVEERWEPSNVTAVCVEN